MAQDISIAALLAEEGFNTLAASRSARETLVRNGLTNHRKKNISVQKLSRVREVLVRELYRVCDDPWCQAIAGMEARGREIVTVAEDGCQVCRGAKSCRSLKAAALVFEKRQIRRVVIVGGTKAGHNEIAAHACGSGVEFRFVDGTKPGRASQLAAEYARWADLMIVWANTPIKHTVSYTYKGACPKSTRLVYATRTGVAGMLYEVISQIA
jgi:hypothetical protein